MPAVAGYEEALLLAALSGLANRAQPTLYIQFTPADAVWRPLLDQSFPGWMENTTVVPLTGNITELVLQLGAYYNGVVLYDPSAWPSSAVATTSAGCEDLLPVCYRPSDPSSLYSLLVASPTGPQLPVKRSLVGLFNASGTGSIKLNAYTWAVNTYLMPQPVSTALPEHHRRQPASQAALRQTSASASAAVSDKHESALRAPLLAPPLADGSLLGYLVDYYWTVAVSNPQAGGDYDKFTVFNADFVIANRGFAFDLGVWTDEAPVDDPDQPLGSDYAAFKLVLGAAYNATYGYGAGNIASEISSDVSGKGNAHDRINSSSRSAATANDNSGMVHVVGFTPWAYKYVGPASKHNHGGVQAEWATSLLASSYNAFFDADACCIGDMQNAALWMHYPISNRLVQAPPPSMASLIARGLLAVNSSTGSDIGIAHQAQDQDGASTRSSTASALAGAGGAVYVPGNRLYYMFYAGDYDSAAWLYSQLIGHWNDTARGSVPIGWGIDPELSLRFPPIFPLVYGTATPGVDVIISGDSGSGYVNPTALYGATRANVSGLPDGRDAWIAYNTAWYRHMGLTFTGFAISGDAPQMDPTAESMYFNFSANGVVDQGWPGLNPHITGNMPVFTQTDLPSDPHAAAADVLTYWKASEPTPQFQMFRSVLTSPSFFASVASQASTNSSGSAIVVDPLTLSYLARVAYGGSNDNRVAYVADTLPVPSTAASSTISTSGAPGPSEAVVASTGTKRPDVAGGGAGSSSAFTLNFTVTVRNDGWNTLPAANHSLQVTLLSGCSLVKFDRRELASLTAVGMDALDYDAQHHQGASYPSPTAVGAAVGRLQLYPRTRRLDTAGSPLRQRLHRLGYRCLPLLAPASTNWRHDAGQVDGGDGDDGVFLLPSDLLIDSNVTVQASISLPSQSGACAFKALSPASAAEASSSTSTSTSTPAAMHEAASSGCAAWSASLYTIQYQVVEVSTAANGTVSYRGMGVYGNIPWVADVLV